MSLDCFNGLISLPYTCGPASSSLPLSGLPGITLTKVASTATEEDISGAQMFNRLHTEAVRQAAEDFITILSDQVTFQQQKFNVINGIIGENSSILDSGIEYIESSSCQVGRAARLWDSDPLKSLRVDFIEIAVTADITDKEIFMQNEIEVTSKFVNLTTGLNRIPIGITGKDVRVYFDASDISFAKVRSSIGCNCTELEVCGECTNQGFQVSNIYRCPDENEPWTTYEETPFVMGVASICDQDKFACMYRDELKFAVRWKIAALLMEEIIYTDRKNPIVRNSKTEAERYLAKIMGNVDPVTGFTQRSEYWRSLQSVIKKIRKSLPKSKCLTCDGYRIREGL